MPQAIAAAAAAAASGSSAAAITSVFAAFKIGIKAGLVYVGTYLASTALITFGLQQLTKSLLGRSAGNESLGSRLQMSRDVVGSRRLIIGECRVSGNIVFAHTTGSDNKYLHIILAIAGHEVEAINNVYFDSGDLALTSSGTDSNSRTRFIPGSGSNFAGKVRIKKYLGTEDQPADADLIAEAPTKWAATRRLRAVAYLYLRLEYDTDVFTGGLPQITCDVKGAKLYDPREIAHDTDNPSTWAWSDNAALAAAYYLTLARERGGVGVKWSEIEQSELSAAATLCDQTIPTTGTDTVKQYVANGVLSLGAPPAENLAAIRSAMSGWVETIGGKWIIRAGEYRTPTLSFNEDDLRSGIQVNTKTSLRENANAIKGIFADADNDWQPVDFPAYIAFETRDVSSINTSTNTINTSSSHGFSDNDIVRITAATMPGGLATEKWYFLINTTATTLQLADTQGGSAVDITSAGTTVVVKKDVYRSEDNGERIFRDITLPLTTEEFASQRLAKIDLLRLREGLGFRATFSFRFFAAQVGDTVRILNTRFGWHLYDAALCGPNFTVDTFVASTNTFGRSTTGTWQVGDPIIFTGGTVPTGYQTQRLYYIVYLDGNDFRLSDRRGGPVIDGSGAVSSTAQKRVGKAFELLSTTLDLTSGEFGVEAELRETFPTLYDWAAGEGTTVSPSPNTSLPDPRDVAAPTTLAVASGDATLYLKKDGTVVSRAKVSWDIPDNIFISSGGQTEVQYKLNADADYITLPLLPGNSDETYIWDVEDGESYDFRVRHINVYGARGPFSSITNLTVGGKTGAPSVPTGLTAELASFLPALSWDAAPESDHLLWEVYRRKETPIDDFPNGDFQDDLNDWRVGESGSSTVTIDSTGGVGSSKAGRLTIDASNSDASLRSEYIFELGKTYRIRFAARASANGVGLRMDSAENFVGVTANGIASSFPLTTSFVDYEVEWTVLADRRQFQFARGNSAASQSIWIDNVTVAEVENEAKVASVDVTEFVGKALQRGSVYYYRIRAKNRSGIFSGYTAPVILSAPAKQQDPNPGDNVTIANLNANLLSPGVIYVSWSNSGPDIERIRVRYGDPSANIVHYDGEPITATTIFGLSPGDYEVEVTGFNGDNSASDTKTTNVDVT